MKPIELEAGAERLQHLTKDLIRRYQFRDWNQICCYGISISQCHILDTLAETGDLTMQQLAKRMYKSVSTMTRVVAQLVRRGYVKRRQDPEDGRVVHVSITPQGKAIVAAVNRDLIETQKAILQSIPPTSGRVPSKSWRRLPTGPAAGRRHAARSDFFEQILAWCNLWLGSTESDEGGTHVAIGIGRAVHGLLPCGIRGRRGGREDQNPDRDGGGSAVGCYP